MVHVVAVWNEYRFRSDIIKLKRTGFHRKVRSSFFITILERMLGKWRNKAVVICAPKKYKEAHE